MKLQEAEGLVVEADKFSRKRKKAPETNKNLLIVFVELVMTLHYVFSSFLMNLGPWDEKSVFSG